MSDQLTEGVVQIFALDVASINYALRDLSERLDAIKGLRGRALIWDRTQVTSPTVGSDAVDLQSLLTQESRFRLDWISPPGLLISAPGTSYSEVSTALRQQIDWSDLTTPQARIVVQGWGTESGNDKGIALHDGTNTVAEVTWDGNTESLRTGSFTSVSLTTDANMQLRAKGSTATESLVITSIVVEVKVSIKVVSA